MVNEEIILKFKPPLWKKYPIFKTKSISYGKEKYLLIWIKHYLRQFGFYILNLSKTVYFYSEKHIGGCQAWRRKEIGEGPKGTNFYL